MCKCFEERLKYLRSELGLSQTDMAKLMGVSLRVYHRYEKGEQKPSYEKLIPLVKKFNVNINWLLTGEGEMFIKPKKEKESIEEQILQVIANEPEERKQALLDFLKNAWASTTLSTSGKKSEKNC